MIFKGAKLSLEMGHVKYWCILFRVLRTSKVQPFWLGSAPTEVNNSMDPELCLPGLTITNIAIDRKRLVVKGSVQVSIVQFLCFLMMFTEIYPSL